MILQLLPLLPFQQNTKAPQAAGKIHTYFEKGFIMAEIMKFDDFKEHGSENAVKVNTHSTVLEVWQAAIYAPRFELFWVEISEADFSAICNGKCYFEFLLCNI